MINQRKILTTIHFILAGLWIYQGLIPKLIFTSPVEIAIWQMMGLSAEYAKLMGQISGVIEIIFGLIFIIYPTRLFHYLSIIGLFFLLLLMAILMPITLIQAFNPVVMNLAMIGLSYIALLLYQQHSNQSF